MSQAERWRAKGTDTARRLESWAEVLAATHLAFDAHETHRTPGQFQGAVARRAFGDLVLVDCAASPFLGHRGRVVMGAQRDDQQDENILGFQFVRSGIELVREGDRKLALNPGDIVLWDGLQPTDIEIVKPFYKRTLIFPRDRVLALCPRLGEQASLMPLPTRNAERAADMAERDVVQADRRGLTSGARGSTRSSARDGWLWTGVHASLGSVFASHGAREPKEESEWARATRASFWLCTGPWPVPPTCTWGASGALSNGVTAAPRPSASASKGWACGTPTSSTSWRRGRWLR
jgi:hypothetical protein